MNKLEKKVLSLLKEDARYSAEQLAVMLGEDTQSVENTVKTLEKKGIIVKYSAIVDTEKTGEDYVDALIEVKCTPQARSGFDAIAKEIYDFPEVKSVYLMSGTYDLCIKLESKTVRDVSLFVSERLSTIDCVTGTATHFIMKQYKEGGIVMEDDDKRRLVIHE